MQPAEVRLEKVGKRYGEPWVVRDVSLRIGPGEFYTFLGPSGCGKTTLLRMIAGFVMPDQGSIFLDGQLVNQVPPWRREVGMVFQNYALWPHLTVFENVAFGLREHKVPRKEIDARVRKALEQVALTGTESRRPSQLSGGQQQRVALARTLVIQPRVLLLDEPLSNLDAKLRVEMRLELLKLQRGLGLTTVYVTHDQEEALALSTTIAVVNRGQVIQQGQPRMIYEEPADDFVAAFVGQANLLSGKVEAVERDRVVVVVAGRQIEMAASALFVAPCIGDMLCLSIRPEAMEMRSRDKSSDHANRLDGIILASAYQGAFIEYEVAALGKFLKVRVANPKGKRLFQREEEVTLSFAPDSVTAVPAEPERRETSGEVDNGN
jgi:iron(III) transport system ATP-binding protein